MSLEIANSDEYFKSIKEVIATSLFGVSSVSGVSGVFKKMI